MKTVLECFQNHWKFVEASSKRNVVKSRVDRSDAVDILMVALLLSPLKGYLGNPLCRQTKLGCVLNTVLSLVMHVILYLHIKDVQI